MLICVRFVFCLRSIIIVGLCPEQSLRVSKSFVNRAWLWRVYHVVLEEMMCCFLNVWFLTSRCSLSTAFLWNSTAGVGHFESVYSALATCVLRKPHFYCTNCGSHKQRVIGEHLTAAGCDAPFVSFFFYQLRRHFCLLRWKSCDWQVSVLPSNCAVSQSRPLNVDLLPRGVAEDLQSSATALNDFLKNCQHVNALLGSTTCSHYVTICMKKHVYIYLSIYTHF